MTHQQQQREDFSVSLAASSRVNLRDHSTGETSPHIIHAVSVTQPVQSWTVLRDHVDFLALDVALSGAISGLPSCAACPNISDSIMQPGSQQEVDAIVHARNTAQEWLSSVLMVPTVRESPVMRQFLCYGANVVPPQFEGLAWVNFTTTGEAAAASAASANAVRPPSSRPNLDEMEMDDMFALDDDPNGNQEHDDDENSLDSEDDAEYLQGRYAPTEEPLTQSEIMEIQQDNVEMVEDVGSLAQSLGASHLGRSLNLQKEMGSFKHHQTTRMMGGEQMQHDAQGGINIMSSHSGTFNERNQSTPSSPGGIGGAMAKAEKSSAVTTQAHVQGIGDSFHRTAPISAPRLDSFKMIKVIGKGSFGMYLVFLLLAKKKIFSRVINITTSSKISNLSFFLYIWDLSGKVFLVREKQTNEMFALKVLKKDNIIKRNQVEHTKTERSVLGYVKHPFIVGLNMAFQSPDKLYFVLDYWLVSFSIITHINVHHLMFNNLYTFIDPLTVPVASFSFTWERLGSFQNRGRVFTQLKSL